MPMLTKLGVLVNILLQLISICLQFLGASLPNPNRGSAPGL